MVGWQDGLYIYKVIYRKGEQNNADALSRVTKEAQEVNQSEQNEAMVSTCSASKAGAETKMNQMQPL